jgi:hypothetical protein
MGWRYDNYVGVLRQNASRTYLCKFEQYQSMFL